jgi:asparagine synthase (glutamine-hydrolysing)
MKDFQGREKGLLREAVRGLLPDEVLWRKKSPYPKTHNPEYLALVTDRLNAVLSDRNSPVFQIVSKDALKNLAAPESQTASSQPPWYGQLMTRPQTIAYFLQLNYWLDKYKVRLVQ